MSELPKPLTSPDCDCTDLDGFLLNVEKLMASELVALSSHEVIGAAVLLWCRAWKQTPAASLPDDERIIAAFAKMPLPRFKKLKAEVMRGFVKCSDGRLYHRTLAPEAMRAFERKVAFRKKRDTDAERLRNWRKGKGETQNETPGETERETQSETRFVAEGQGQVRERESKKDVERVFDALWREWPDVARKRHTQADCRDAIRRQLRDGANPDDIIAAGKSHVAERISKPETVKGIVRWLANGLWKNWAPNGASGEQTPIDWPLRMKVWRESDGEEWPERWGPKPGQPGFNGPSEDLFTQGAAP